MVVRPTILFEGFQVQIPVDEFSSYGFYQECGFWPSQFQEVIDNLILLPDKSKGHKIPCNLFDVA